MIRNTVLLALGLLQAVAGLRVAGRLAVTARGTRIARCDEPQGEARVTVILPVLNEAHRLAPCLDRLLTLESEVCQVLVIDGGSTDGTPGLVRSYGTREPRLRLVDASPVPPGWNGKAHGLQVGLAFAERSSNWLLTLDADVRLAAGTVRSMIAHARRHRVAALGVATEQRLSGELDGLVHPSLLTTLVYRYGIPGQVTRRAGEVQANGQCSLYQREPLERIGGFAAGRGSVCEDVTIARALVAHGYAVSFNESDDLVEVAMYGTGRETVSNWPRSLPMRDKYSGAGVWLRLADVALAQALPLALVLLGRRPLALPRPLLALNLTLVMMRLGVLVGTARAYPGRPWTYWLSPAFDFPAAVLLWRSAARRCHVWRGRLICREDA